MSKFLATLLLSFSLFLPAPAANAQCLLCGVIGFALGSADSDQYGGGSGNVIYVAPRISERLLADPLEVKITTSGRLYMVRGSFKNFAGSSIQEIFDMTVLDSQKYTVLEVMRMVGPSSLDTTYFWFAYIENEKMRPLSDLPPPSN